MFESETNQEPPNVTDHLSANLNQNMNLLFYNFNNSWANTAFENKRAPSLGMETYTKNQALELK